jgi:hypothetical protein
MWAKRVGLTGVQVNEALLVVMAQLETLQELESMELFSYFLMEDL